MAKLNWANSNGSMSVVIPKKMIEQLNWKYGDDVVLFVRDKKIKAKELSKLTKE